MKTTAWLLLLFLTFARSARAQSETSPGEPPNAVGAAKNLLPPLTPGFGPDLTRLEEQQKKDVELVLEPLNRRYSEALQQLYQRATAAGDLDTARKIRAELGRLGLSAGLRAQELAQTFEQRLAGTTWSFPLSGKISSITFQPGGVLVIGWNPFGVGFTWRIAGDKIVEVFPYANKQHGEIVRVGEDERKAKLNRDGKDMEITRLK